MQGFEFDLLDKFNNRAFHNIVRTALFLQAEEDYDAERVISSRPDFSRSIIGHYLLTHQNQPVATIGLERLKTNVQAGAITLVSVSSEQQGKGYGKQLLFHTIEKAKQLGLTKICVNAAPDAVNFYKNSNFKDEIWDKEYLDSWLPHNGPKPTQLSLTL